MTQAQLEALVDTLLASNQPDKIIAVKHRQVEDAIIEELFDYQSLGDRFKDLVELSSLVGTEKIVIIKNGVAKLLPATIISGGNGTLVMKGAWDASTNQVPNLGNSSVLQGYVYDNGNFSSTSLLGPDGNVILPYATIRALVNAPGPLLSDPTKWRVTY